MNSASSDWLSYLRAQLNVSVGRVCLPVESKKIISALFSENDFFTKRRHCKELQVKENFLN